MLQTSHVTDEGDERSREIFFLSVSEFPKRSLEGLFVLTAHIVGEENRGIESPTLFVDELGSDSLQLFGTHVIHQSFCIRSDWLWGMSAYQCYAGGEIAMGETDLLGCGKGRGCGNARNDIHFDEITL